VTEPLTDEQVRAILARADTPGSSYTAVQATLHALGTALLAARAKNSELNRRCQAAEKAARQTIEQAKRAGGSFGRALANYAARLYSRERDDARADAVRAAMHATGLPHELALRIDGYRLQLEQQGEQRA
jgi:hypothetical protein